jgi:hypothetical protein
MGAVTLEPRGPLLVVDDLEPVLEDAIPHEPGHRGGDGVEDREEEAQVGVTVTTVGYHVGPEPVPEAAQKADQEALMRCVRGGGWVRAASPLPGQLPGEVQEWLGPDELGVEDVRGHLARDAGKPGRHEARRRLAQVERWSLTRQLAPAPDGPLDGGRRHLPERWQLARDPGGLAVSGRVERECVPSLALPVIQDHLVASHKRLLERRQRDLAWRPPQRVVGLAHEPEGVVVEAEPDV